MHNASAEYETWSGFSMRGPVPQRVRTASRVTTKRRIASRGATSITRMAVFTMTNVPRYVSALAISLRQQAQQVQKEAHVFYFAFKHPRMRWYARLVAGCTAGYLLSPIQLIPSYIPGIGFLDDLLVLFLGAKLLQKITPLDVMTECRELAEEADVRRKGEIGWAAAVAVPAAVVALWLLSAIATSALMASYLHHH